MTTAPLPSFHPLAAQAGWQAIDFLSDLHLQAPDATFEAWRHHLLSTDADAVFLLGDLFEAWVGDDSALGGGPDGGPSLDTRPGFAADCARVLREAAARRPLFLMHGNRDFLVGEPLAHACGFTLLPDPTVLLFAGRRWLLTHGDLLCLSDQAYLRYREQMRRPEFLRQVLTRPLAEREAQARQMREASQAHQSSLKDAVSAYVDVDEPEVLRWLQAAQCEAMIHGHTHRPADHAPAPGLHRHVLSDWDLLAQPPRAQVLRLRADGSVHRQPPA